MLSLLDLECGKDGRTVPLRDTGSSLPELGTVHCDATYDVAEAYSAALDDPAWYRRRHG
jgi:hypothetical protein